MDLEARKAAVHYTVDDAIDNVGFGRFQVGCGHTPQKPQLSRAGLACTSPHAAGIMHKS